MNEPFSGSKVVPINNQALLDNEALSSDPPAVSTTWEGSAARLLDRELPRDYLLEWTAHVAGLEAVTQAGTKSVVIFRIDKEWLALSTSVFQEVMEQCTIRTLPHHNGGVVKGLVNVRGELLVCVSLQVFLGMEKSADICSPGSSGRVMILNREGGRFAFQVSEVYGIHRYHPTELRPAPATLTKAATAPYTAGILRWNGRAVGCLAEDLLIYSLNKGLA